MPVAIVLINVRAQETARVAEELAGIDGVAEVYSVAGDYDLTAIVRVRNNDELAEVISKKIRGVADVVSTKTLIAFRAYSKNASSLDVD